MKAHVVRTAGVVCGIGGLFLALGASPAPALAARQAGARSQRTVWDGVYTEAQAQRGQAAYKQSCESCHSEDLRGRGNAPSLVEESFAFQWGDLSVADLLAKTQLMPSDRPGSLPLQTYIDIIAFVLQKNGMPTGQQELGADVTTLKQIFITAKPATAGKTALFTVVLNWAAVLRKQIRREERSCSSRALA